MMPSTATRSNDEVSQVTLLEVEPDKYDAVLRETSADVHRLGAKIHGLVGIEVYGTADQANVLLISRWVNREAWAKAQWDDDLQKAVVARFASARRVHRNLYTLVDADSERR